ncbi:hypothetical protein N7491_005202 [Penicillium cf. griseofulvum]|nr:hypothetical protein N7491_005202 [Penicillium cf. griseofulvum]
MHFSKSLATAATLAMTVYAGFPVARVTLLSWEGCSVGRPTLGEPKYTTEASVNPLICDRAPVNRDWTIDNFSFNVHMATKDTAFCYGMTVWNNDNCSGKPVHFQPFQSSYSPLIEGKCLPDILDPGFVSFKLACEGFP